MFWNELIFYKNMMQNRKILISLKILCKDGNLDKNKKKIKIIKKMYKYFYTNMSFRIL